MLLEAIRAEHRNNLIVMKTPHGCPALTNGFGKYLSPCRRRCLCRAQEEDVCGNQVLFAASGSFGRMPPPARGPVKNLGILVSGYP